ERKLNALPSSCQPRRWLFSSALPPRTRPNQLIAEYLWLLWISALQKRKTQHMAGLREDGRQETALTASCLICSCSISRTNHVTNHCILDLFFPISTNS
ncbi:hypothetical protein D6K12_24655, partial [Salmonella enterica subsp. enterica serovar Montevideo]|nr:hypothetical protein [Salmonella enterica subsp. enterica serovar Montevideo]